MRLLIVSQNPQRVRERVFFGTRFPVCSSDRELIFSISSAIIEDLQSKREAGSVLLAYYYFDYKDSSKRDIRGLLASLVFQLGDDSVLCWGAFYQLYIKCRDGSDQPSNAALAS